MNSPDPTYVDEIKATLSRLNVYPILSPEIQAILSSPTENITGPAPTDDVKTPSTSSPALPPEFRVLPLTREIEVEVGRIVSRKHHLKEMLQDPELEEKLGESLVKDLQFTVGDVKGMNLKNLAWHGFLSPIMGMTGSRLVRDQLTELRKITSTYPDKKENIPLPPLPTLNISHPKMAFVQIAKISTLIHPDHRQYWETLYAKFQAEPHYNLLSVGVTLFQHCLRRLWVAVMATRDPEFRESRVTANNTDFYVTLDEIFSPVWSGEVCRPGASYYTTVYNQSKMESEEHVLIPILGGDLFAMLLDIFVHGEGPRLRDKMSHGEVGDIPEEMARHVTCVMFRVLGLFAEEGGVAREGAEGVAKEAEGVAREGVARELQYPRCGIYHPWEMVKTQLEQAEGHLATFETLTQKTETPSEPLPDVVTNLLAYCTEANSNYIPPIVPMFLGPDKVRHYKMILAVCKNHTATAETLVVMVTEKRALLEARQLRSRQRDNLIKLERYGPALLGAMRCWKDLVFCFLSAVEERREASWGMKVFQKCFENTLTAARESKWDNMFHVVVWWMGSEAEEQGGSSGGGGGSSTSGGGGGGWWGSSGLSAVGSSLWNKAKETGSNVYEFTSNDMSEVATSLKQDVLGPSASALKHKLQPYAQTTMLGNVSEYLAPEPQNVQYLSRFGEDRLAAIQTSPETYTQHTADAHFNEWSEGFVLESHTHEIGEILVVNDALRQTHSTLVPAHLSYGTFWRVYYYRTHLFNLEKEKHEELLSRAEARGEEEDELKWSDDDEEEEEEEKIEEKKIEEDKEKIEKIEESKEETPTSTPTAAMEPDVEKELSTEESLEQAASEPSTTPQPQEEQGPTTAEEEVSCSSDSTAEKMVSEQSTAAVGGGENSIKADLSSEDSYEMIKEKGKERLCDRQTDRQTAETNSTPLPADIASCDQDFERELDQMIEHIQLEESPDNVSHTCVTSHDVTLCFSYPAHLIFVCHS
eukprot:sb/3461641/